MVRYLILLIILFCGFTTSCRTQEQNEKEALEIAQQRLKEIDLSQPDKYPLFDNCGELENAINCFYEKLQEQVALKLKDHQLQFEITHRDSVMAIILVDKKGTISYTGLQNHAADEKAQILDSLLNARLQQICKIEPAYKQNVPVNSSYLLPVIIKPTAQHDAVSN